MVLEEPNSGGTLCDIKTRHRIWHRRVNPSMEIINIGLTLVL
jgi:hypothetical protein